MKPVYSLFLALCGILSGQVSNNQSLSGKYYFRYLLLTTDGTSNVLQARSASGTMTFDGNGGYAATGQFLLGSTASQALSTAGTYSVKPGGFVTLSSPLQTFTINARLGASGLVGSATEAGSDTYDLFIAIPAPAQPVTSSVLSGTYWITSLELPSGSMANLRETNFKLTANNAGSFTETSVTGQARNLGNRLQTQIVSPLTYTVASDGTGTLTFPLAAGLDANSQLISGVKNIYVSQDGSYFIGGSTAAGGLGLVVGVKAFTSGAAWSGFFVAAGLRFETSPTRLSSAVGAVNATTLGSIWARRTRQPDGLFDASALIGYSLSADGSGNLTSTTGRLSVASTGTTFATTGLATTDSTVYEIYFGSQMVAQSGTGVFLNPQGVLNAASFAPPGYPISPGGFITLFGSGFGTQTTKATAFPFPTILGGIQVTINGISAPVYSVTPSQISAVVPYGVTGSTATIVVTVNQTKSNSVDVPLSPTAPGIFSIPNNGLGDGAILHADFSLVSQANPALPGETVQIFLTGLGAVIPPVADGAAAPSREPLARVPAPLNVYIGGLSTPPAAFKGLAPGLAGLYQLNVQVPINLGPGNRNLAIQTIDGFTDMVNIWVGSPL